MNEVEMNHSEIQIYPPDKQASGEFDGGRITEIKPIGFSGDGSAVDRVGPLFYWAWASSTESAKIGLHPHRGFEIISYVLSGEVGHGDTLGNATRVASGGAQVMQTGSGVSHEEQTGDDTEFFQIWFEPDLREAVTRSPVYQSVRDEEFPVVEEAGVRIKRIIGKSAPVALVSDALMEDVLLEPGTDYSRGLSAGRTLAFVVVKGRGTVLLTGDERELPVEMRDFAVARAHSDSSVRLRAHDTAACRVVAIEVPSQVDYTLIGK